MRATRMIVIAAGWALGAISPPTAAAAAIEGRQLAAACAGCHLVERQDTLSAESANIIPHIAGLSETDIVARMLAYRADDNSSQVMHVISGALSKEEITAIAHYITSTSAKKPPGGSP